MYSPVIAHIHVPKTAGAAFRTLLRNRFGTDHSDLDVADTYFVYSEPEIEAHIAERPSLRSLSSHFVRTYPSRVAGREMLYVTFLRNPVEQFISYLTFTRKIYETTPDRGLVEALPPGAPEMPLREVARWILLQSREVPFRENYVVNYFARYAFLDLHGPAEGDLYRTCRLVQAKTVINQFFFVGITERMEESVRRLERVGARCGVEMPRGPIGKENVSSEFRDDLRWVNRSDEVGAMLYASIAEDLQLYEWAVARFNRPEQNTGSHGERRAVRAQAPEARPGGQRFATQLFWRYEGDGFTEQQSIQRYWAAELNDSHLRMELPRFERVPAQLRLDLTDRPMRFRLSEVSFLNSAGEPIWTLDLCTSERVPMAGMTITPAEGGIGVLVDVANHDPAMLLPMDYDALRRLSQGASLEISMSSVASAADAA